MKSCLHRVPSYVCRRLFVGQTTCQRDRTALLTGSGALVRDDSADSTPESIDVLAVHSHNLQAVTLKRLRDVVALKVLRRVTSNGNIVVVDDQLDVQVLRDGKTGGLGIISLLFQRACL